MLYKRNQLDEAIVRTLGVKDARVADLKLKIKRLLVTDRRLGRGERSGNAGRSSAFYSQKPLGSGFEVMFTGFEVFAVLVALIVLEFGIPQAKVVGILQEIRSDLQAAHRETLEKDPKVLFAPQAVRALARPGMIAVDNTAPVFLAAVKLDAGKGRVRAFISVCRGHDELVNFIKEYSGPGSGAAHWELARLMLTLADNLSLTRPVKRGRSTV